MSRNGVEARQLLRDDITEDSAESLTPFDSGVGLRRSTSNGIVRLFGQYDHNTREPRPEKSKEETDTDALTKVSGWGASSPRRSPRSEWTGSWLSGRLRLPEIGINAPL